VLQWIYPLAIVTEGLKSRLYRGACRQQQYYDIMQQARLQCFEGPARFAGGWKLFQKGIHGIREIVYSSFPIYYTKLFGFKAALRSILIHIRIYGVLSLVTSNL